MRSSRKAFLTSVSATVAISLLSWMVFGVANAGRRNNKLEVRVTDIAEMSVGYEVTDTIEPTIHLDTDDDNDLWVSYEECFFTMSITSTEKNDDNEYEVYATEGYECIDDEEEEVTEEETTDEESTDDEETTDAEETTDEDESTGEETTDEESEAITGLFEIGHDTDSIEYNPSLSFENLEPAEYRFVIDFDAEIEDEYYGYVDYLTDYETTIGIYSNFQLTADSYYSEYYDDEIVTGYFKIVNETGAAFSYDRECSEGPQLYLYDEDENLVHSDGQIEQECDWHRTNYIKSWATFKEYIIVYNPTEEGTLDAGTYTLVIDLGEDYELTAEATFEIVSGQEEKDDEPSEELGEEEEETRYSGELSDIEDHWAEGYIDTLYVAHVIDGYSDSTFRPDQSITRAEFVKMVVNALGTEMVEGSNSFDDVAISAWFYEYVEAATAADYINGYTDGNFLPGGNITRAEAMSVLTKAADLVDYRYNSSMFYDVTEEWQVAYIANAYRTGIIEGYKDTDGYLTREFGPNNELTRAEAAKIIYLAMLYL